MEWKGVFIILCEVLTFVLMGLFIKISLSAQQLKFLRENVNSLKEELRDFKCKTQDELRSLKYKSREGK